MLETLKCVEYLDVILSDEIGILADSVMFSSILETFVDLLSKQSIVKLITNIMSMSQVDTLRNTSIV